MNVCWNSPNVVLWKYTTLSSYPRLFRAIILKTIAKNSIQFLGIHLQILILTIVKLLHFLPFTRSNHSQPFVQMVRKMPDIKFHWPFTIYREEHEWVRPDHNSKMAVKNFKWKAHLISTRIIPLEVLDYLHDFPTIYFKNFPVGQNWLTNYILTEM